MRRERNANHKRHWIVLLLLFVIGGVVHAYMYQDVQNNSCLDDELSSKVENYVRLLLKEHYTNSSMTLSLSIASHYQTLILSIVTVILVLYNLC